MIVLNHELKQGSKSFLVWTLSIGLFIVVCVFLFPQMEEQMSEANDLFASMGSLSSAFGMDKINFGEFWGYYGVECGNILGLGGALYAALLGITIISKEEKNKTAEFLLCHPVSRAQIVTEKLLASFVLITAMNILIMAMSGVSVLAIGEVIDWDIFLLIHIAYYMLELEICSVCIGTSVFLSSASYGIGIGFAVVLYFLNIIANITDDLKFLKYITPFSYAESADIIDTASIDLAYLGVGVIYSIVGIALGYFYYNRKDIS